MNNLREIRESKGISQSELTELVRLYYPATDKALIGQLERVDIYPGDYLLKALCKALNCSESDFHINPHERSTYQIEYEKNKEREIAENATHASQKSCASVDDLHCVYMHTFPNGKRYIGQTKSGKTKLRWCNGRGYYWQKKLYSAILAFGWDNIKHEVLYDNLTQEEATAIEKRLIEEYNSISDGYNLVCEYNGRKRRSYGTA